VLLRLFALWTNLVLRALGGRRRRLEVGGASVAYWTVGRSGGEPWLLLHGLGSTALSWSPLLLALRRECRLVVVELSELGGTRSASGGGLAIREGTEVAKALLDHEFPGRRVTLAGISLGGWIAVRTALERPARLERLVLVDAGGFRDQDWGRIQELVTVRTLADVDRFYRALFVRPPLAFRFSRRGFLEAFRSPAVVDVLGAIVEADAFDARDLGRIAVPTALVWGEQDGLFTLEVARAIERAIPGARLYSIREAGHGVHWEKPRELVAAVLDFRRAAPARE
jgi:pimeloyl-ACP methyl ester carboxylesterase